MPYFPKAEAPNVQPYWCPLCAAWYLPQCGPVQTSCCVNHPPGSCCHMGETKLVAEGSQPTFVRWVPYVPTVAPWWQQPWTITNGAVASDNVAITGTMIAGNTSLT